ncbi:MAG TPA: hypothetical protein VEK08_17515 [Planctomycetota bacterium]|nr:hypothetical protein [Planctomycetota bacterium]
MSQESAERPVRRRVSYTARERQIEREKAAEIQQQALIKQTYIDKKLEAQTLAFLEGSKADFKRYITEELRQKVAEQRAEQQRAHAAKERRICVIAISTAALSVASVLFLIVMRLLTW